MFVPAGPQHWALLHEPAPLCPVCHQDIMKAERASAEHQQSIFQVLRKQGFSEDSEDSFGGLGGFCLLFVFPEFLLLSFPSSDTGSQLHKPPVGNHSHHSGIRTSWGHVFLTLWKLSWENCLVKTRRHPGGKKVSFLLVSLPSSLELWTVFFRNWI